jgi:UDP-N-acetylmuramoyl-L-alanyl-D-glutamate--2,6-diaminopimelate ligase
LNDAAKIFGDLAAQGAMIERLCADSRRAGPGAAFLAYPGERADGRAHIADAVARGAAAVLYDPQDGFGWPADVRAPHAAVAHLKQRSGGLAHQFYGRPSEKLWMCGVTGTNGKTSCTHWIASLLDRKNVAARVIGTLGSGIPGSLQPLANTTPEAVELHGVLKRYVEENAAAVAMEVSSHGLVQGRVNGVAFNCALFTNLSHDHLDYHGSMDAYAEAKGRLFDTPGLETAVLNLDDVVGVQLARRLSVRGMRTIGYSLSRGGIAPGSVREFVFMDNGAIESSWGRAPVRIDALGRFNAANALGVLGCLVAYGVPFQEAAAMLERLPAVPGRMERIAEAPLVVVDYAHTPDALEKVLHALRPVAQGRGGALVAVFGAGGDRDPAKRPLMGEIAGRLADRVVVTSDNPRSEDPLEIIAAIRGGIARAHEAEPDRAKAIRQAIAAAAAQDVVLIAGKGHESFQEILGKRVPFSDAAVAREALAGRGGA